MTHGGDDAIRLVGGVRLTGLKNRRNRFGEKNSKAGEKKGLASVVKFYVSNLPAGCRSWDLSSALSAFGVISGTYIARKKDKEGSLGRTPMEKGDAVFRMRPPPGHGPRVFEANWMLDCLDNDVLSSANEVAMHDQNSSDGSGRFDEDGTMFPEPAVPETGLVDLNSSALSSSGVIVSGNEMDEDGGLDDLHREDLDPDRGLEQEVNDTVGVGKLIGVNLENYLDEVRNLIMEEGSNGGNG
ncbi:hypothetical protein L1987_32353 [Smallanthus sonchifolius]|uniref:Uncharacterized protein n=1 Tax=Smallanthus sonchifolius TaxID=185202 RepID=A0ACB9I860_9ASTR|nr:hypothetical protein L1987_32353 [Smallanthus sonchifolius]